MFCGHFFFYHYPWPHSFYQSHPAFFLSVLISSCLLLFPHPIASITICSWISYQLFFCVFFFLNLFPIWKSVFFFEYLKNIAVLFFFFKKKRNPVLSFLKLYNFPEKASEIPCLLSLEGDKYLLNIIYLKIISII